jgi:predicted AlkP superfamily pyrophosphatase or phosphodiesterase
VLLILDGFSYDYLQEECFDEIRNRFNFLRPMKPSPGWSSKPTLYTGDSPKSTDLFTQYWLSDRSQFRWLKTRTSVMLSPMAAALFGGFFRKFLGYRILPNTRIPLNALQYFDVSDGYRRAINMKHPVGLSEKDLKIVYTKNVDEAGHIHGASSLQTRQEIEAAANTIRKFLDNQNIENFFIVGDHGMVDIEREIDILPLLKETGLRYGKDFLYFIDSTMVRFWFADKSAKDSVVSLLGRLKSVGRLLSEKEKKSLGIDFKHRKYGDIIFWLRMGTTFEPSFFHRWTFRGSRKNLGMHGYMEDRTLVGIKTKEKLDFRRVEEVEMTSFYPTMMEILDKSYKCEGMSLLE